MSQQNSFNTLRKEHFPQLGRCHSCFNSHWSDEFWKSHFRTDLNKLKYPKEDEQCRERLESMANEEYVMKLVMDILGN